MSTIETDNIVKDSAVTPISPKKMPKLGVKAPKQSNAGVKEKAIELIEKAFKDERAGRHSIAKRINTLPDRDIFEAFQNFEDALGGRSKLIECLQHCPQNSAGYALIQRLVGDQDFLTYAIQENDTQTVRFSLGSLCDRHKIPLNTVVTAFKDATAAKIAFETLTKLSIHTPKVIEQVVEDSQSRYVACATCEGTGRIWRINQNGEWDLTPDGEHLLQLCHGCRGQGRIFKDRDIQDRKLFLQMTGLLDQNKTPLVQQTFNQNAQVFKGDFLPGDGSFERLLKTVDTVTAPKGAEDAIDVPFTVYEEGKEEEKSSL